MDFDKFLKKYVWDEDKTPYLTPADKLSRRQIHYEVAAYSVFLAILFGAVALASLTGAAGPPRSPTTALYAFTMVCAGVVLGFTKAVAAALYAASAPVAAVVYLMVNGLRPAWGTIDVIIVTLFICAWMAYSLRVVRIGRRFDLLDQEP